MPKGRWKLYEKIFIVLENVFDDFDDLWQERLYLYMKELSNSEKEKIIELKDQIV